jgi:hypothetical protein
LLKKSVRDFFSAELRRMSAVRRRQINDLQSLICGRAIHGPRQQAAETEFQQPASGA